MYAHIHDTHTTHQPQSFLELNQTSFDELVRVKAQMQHGLKKALLFYGEDPVKTTTDAFFGIFTNFLSQWEVGSVERILHATSCHFTRHHVT